MDSKEIKNQDDLIERLVTDGKDIVEDLVKNEMSREKSWQHCYKIFKNFKNKTMDEREEDLLALNLGFYLASFGMYRGSSFLINYDYKIHKNVIKKFNEEKDKIICGDFINYDTYNELKEGISNSYKLYAEQSKNFVTETLVTKILLGVFSCIPAFDRNLRRVLKEAKDKLGEDINQSVNEKTIAFLQELATKVENKELEELNQKQKEYLQNNGYNKVRILDLCVWAYGAELLKKDK